MTTTIRPLVETDRAAWEPLWQGYLAFYQTTLPEVMTDLTWRRIHDPTVPLHALGAVVDGRLVGFATFLYHLSTWSPQQLCYLEDLFVAPDLRSRGLARALIEAVGARARGDGADRLYWQTHVTNHTARALYDRVAQHAGFIVYGRNLAAP